VSWEADLEGRELEDGRRRDRLRECTLKEVKMKLAGDVEERVDTNKFKSLSSVEYPKARRKNKKQSENKSMPKHHKNHHGIGPPSAPRFIPKEQTVRPSASRSGHYSLVHPQISR
jgi:hypothetical protein